MGNNQDKKNKQYLYRNCGDYEIKLKYEKLKLSFIYIIIMAIGVIVWMVATGDANSAEFSSWISFASTVASIILSVIAIIMSITGENKTDAMKNQMEETAKELELTAQAIDEANKKSVDNINELKQSIDLLQRNIELLQGKTDKVLNAFQKTKEQNVFEAEKFENESRRMEWVKKNEE